MATPSYGPIVKSRAELLLEVILDFVDSSVNPTDTHLEGEWQQEDGSFPELVVQTNLESLAQLTQKDRYEGELTVDQIKRALTDLNKFLQIIPENPIKPGSQDLSFTLKLWSKEKRENLQKFGEEWEKRKLENSKPQKPSIKPSEPISHCSDITGTGVPAVNTLYKMLPTGTEGGKQFARLIDILLIHEARQNGKKFTNFSDAAGDYNGLDSFEGDAFRREGTIGYQYKFYPSPLSSSHRSSIKDSLKTTAKKQEEIKLTKWILVTPEDLTESGRREDKGDTTWFEGLRQELQVDFELEHWGHMKIQSLFLASPIICLRYYPSLIPDGQTRQKTIKDLRERYDKGLKLLHKKIEFVGMSVYKPEATRGVSMENIYIPLTVVPEAASREDNISRIDPLSLLKLGKHNVILGDPGSGKSTLLKFLALAGISEELQRSERYRTSPDERLPILIVLRRYVDELKSRRNLSLIDYIKEVIQADFSLTNVDAQFFQYFLEAGQTILLFDGLDELPDSQYKKDVKDRICTLDTTYPGNTIIVTSRIVGYDSYFRFDEQQFSHYRLTNLQLPEIEQFISDWYKVRIENKKERQENIDDLANLLRDNDHKAIRELAENPLLLTIITLVHRIDAVLPDERVVLYQKCTETLLNTWHSWKFKSSTKIKGKGKIERRNRQRMEAIANWMHGKSVSIEAKQRAVVPHDELKDFLSDYIHSIENTTDGEDEPQDLAEDFLDFIKKRAGLLIEAGDKQYSFVHLTFQEYLTSCYLNTRVEGNAVKDIWEKEIKAKCSESRWQEVIRLLIASFKNNDNQEFFIKQILKANTNSIDLNISLLLGGLLLDGIEAAETLQTDILTNIFSSAIEVKELDELRPLLSILRIWSAKDPSNHTTIRSVFSSLWKTTTDLATKKSLSLIAYTLNWTQEEINEVTQEAIIYERNDVNFLQVFFGEATEIRQSNLLTENIELLWGYQDYLSSTSSIGNFFAALSQSLNLSLGIESFSQKIFEQYLTHIGYGIDYGSFRQFSSNIFQLSINNQFVDNQKINLARARARARARDRALDRALARARDLARALARARDRDLARALDRARALALDRALARARALDRALALVREDDQNFWQAILDDSEVYSFILDLFCDIFALEPRAQWWEALRISFLPRIPERIPLFDQDIWSKVELAFTEGTPTQADIYFAAWQLLLDVWLYVFEGYDSPNETIVARLVDLTKENQAPPLCIAHCIRDIAYGNKSRTKDLIAMVNSAEPVYSSIFETCYWKDST